MNLNPGWRNNIITKDKYGLEQFLRDYPGMSIAPSRNKETIIKGVFSFVAKPVNEIEISDFYHLKIIISDSFLKVVPNVVELDRKIPRNIDHHINTSDDTFCFGSPLELKIKLTKNPTLTGFSENILVPYLYCQTYKRIHGKFPFGELAHGEKGVIQSYKVLFKLNERIQIYKALELLTFKKRIANKKLCPCGCNLSLSKCNFRFIINKFRDYANKQWYRNHLLALKKEYENSKN